MAGVLDNLPTDAVADGEQDQHSNAETLSTDDSTDHSCPADLSDALPVSERPKSDSQLRPSPRSTIFLDASVTQHQQQATRQAAHLSLPPPAKSAPAPAAAAPEVQNAPKRSASSVVGTLRFLKKKIKNKKKAAQDVLEAKNTETFYVALWRCAADADNELSFEKGDRLRIVDAQHEARGWLLAELGGKIGLVPINYLRKCS